MLHEYIGINEEEDSEEHVFFIGPGLGLLELELYEYQKSDWARNTTALAAFSTADFRDNSTGDYGFGIVAIQL